MSDQTAPNPAFAGPVPENIARIVGMEKHVLGYVFAPLIIDIFLLGVLLMQVYTYFTYQKGDKKITKYVVGFVLFVNIAFSGYHTYYSSWIFVDGFGQYTRLFTSKRTAIIPLIDSINSLVVQCFMSYRAYRLLHRAMWIPISVARSRADNKILCLISVGSCIGVFVIYIKLESLVNADLANVPQLLWLTSVMLADLIITTTIVYGLVKSKTGWAHTDKLVRMTIEGQVPPFIVALTFMITNIANPETLLGGTLQSMQCKLYACGMLYSINARITFRLKLESRGTTGGQVFALSHTRQHPTEINVQIDTETYTHGPYSSTYVTKQEEEGDSISDIVHEGQASGDPHSRSHLCSETKST